MLHRRKIRDVRAIDRFRKKINDSRFWNYIKNREIKDKNGCEYILFRIDAYFTEYLLAAEIDEQTHEGRELTFEKKRHEALEQKLDWKFIRINTSKAENGYDLDYEVGNAEAFIDEFKDRQLEIIRKKNQTENKKARRQNERKSIIKNINTIIITNW